MCSPSQVLGVVYTEVLEAAHLFHRGPTDLKRSIGPLLSLPEVYNQLFSFAHVQRETVEPLLSSFSAEVHTAKSSHFHNKINSAPDMRNLFRKCNSLLCPPSPPPTTSITADDFAIFLTDKTKTISSQFSPPLTQDLQPTRSTAQTPIFSFCPLTETEVPNFSSPAILQHVL